MLPPFPKSANGLVERLRELASQVTPESQAEYLKLRAALVAELLPYIRLGSEAGLYTISHNVPQWAATPSIHINAHVDENDLPILLISAYPS